MQRHTKVNCLVKNIPQCVSKGRICCYFFKRVFFVSEDTFAKNVLPILSDTPKSIKISVSVSGLSPTLKLCWYTAEHFYLSKVTLVLVSCVEFSLAQ